VALAVIDDLHSWTVSEMKTKKVLFLQRTQYGRPTMTVKLAERMAADTDVVVSCFDAGMPKVYSPGVDVRYVGRHGSFVRRAIRLLRHHLACINSCPGAVIVVIYFPGCSVLGLMMRRNAILDFRTGSVHSSPIVRWIENGLASVESLFFRRITIISDRLRRRLLVPKRKSAILPIGADVISSARKIFDWPRLLYIGTLRNRRIEDTIHGVSVFLERNPEFKGRIKYEIVGDGERGKLASLRDLICKLGLDNVITLWGTRSHSEVKSLFDVCNIGISYVPITSYYNVQPPTKTYEYIRSGIPAIATSTVENSALITEENGVLCEDNPEGFASALEKCVARFDRYSDSKVRISLAGHSWDTVEAAFRSAAFSCPNTSID
jgi:hypothetical protein